MIKTDTRQTEYERLHAKGSRLLTRGERLWDRSKGYQTECERLWNEGLRFGIEGDRLQAEGKKRKAKPIARKLMTKRVTSLK